MSHSDKLLRGYYGQMRCCDRLMRSSCGKVRAGRCKHPIGWRPKSSVKFGDGGTTVTTKNYIRLRSTNFLEWITPYFFALILVNFRHISIVKVLRNFSAASKVKSVAYIFGLITPYNVGSVLWRLFSTLEVVQYIGGITSVLWGVASVLWRLLSTVGG